VKVDSGVNDRVVVLNGVHNFRDYGGYRSSFGGQLRRNLLWRSGQHHGASDSDLALIEGLGLAHVCDLRNERERDSHPCRRPEGFAAKVHIIAASTAGAAPHVSALSGAHRSPETAHLLMIKSYEGMPYRGRQNELLRRFYADLACGDGPSLINCMAGKDRTGFSVAMLHYALGVHPDDILADYMMTNTAGDAEARIAAGSRAIQDVIGEIDPATLRVIMGVSEEYLTAAIAAIRETHGSIDAYLAEVLGLDEGVRGALRDRLIET